MSDFWLQVLGFILSLIVAIGTAGKWLLFKVTETWTAIDDLHKRINDVKDTYVRRDDFKETIERVTNEAHATRKEIKDDLDKVEANLNQRFDQVMMALAKGDR